MGVFPLGKFLCSCRFGLEANTGLCSHFKIEKLSSEVQNFRRFEERQTKPSDFFHILDAYIDDPEFWAEYLDFKVRVVPGTSVPLFPILRIKIYIVFFVAKKSKFFKNYKKDDYGPIG